MKKELLNRKIGILGCGWLGKALGEHLVSSNALVKGTVRRNEKLNELKALGIEPFLISITPEKIDGDFEEFISGLDVLVISLPPGKRKNSNYNFSKSIDLILKKLSSTTLEKIIFISSTSVFADSLEIPVYNERSLPKGTSTTAGELIKAEDLITSFTIPSTVIRPGGLIGSDRNPIKYLAGKTSVSNPEAPVNLVHQKYLIELIIKQIESSNTIKILHAISEPHESRSTYYKNQAIISRLEPPIFNFDTPSEGKRIVSML